MQLDILRDYYKEDFTKFKYPTTRYQGSKFKISDWIFDEIAHLEFDSFLDAFGGTGIISYKMKQMGKEVHYNDIMKFNCIIANALIKNGDSKLSDEEVSHLLNQKVEENPTTIEKNFEGIFYTNEENMWLDQIVYKINKIENEYKKSLALFALFQACIIKRPYNLFHRANLNVRTNNVKRSFGNKTTWDTPFEVHFKNFIKEANASIFDNGREMYIYNQDIKDLSIEKGVDLVYIDTPYISSNGVGTDYLDFYHFLEGIANYDNWENLILNKYKHKPIEGKGKSVWTKKTLIFDAFHELIKKYRNSTLVISYREDGIPNIDELVEIIKLYKKGTIEIKTIDYKYALSKRDSKEVLIIAK